MGYQKEIDDTFKKLATCGSVKDIYFLYSRQGINKDVETHGV